MDVDLTLGWAPGFVVAIFCLFVCLSLVWKQFLVPHALAERYKLGEALGRDPVRGEITRLQAFYLFVANYSDAKTGLFVPSYSLQSGLFMPDHSETGPDASVSDRHLGEDGYWGP